MGDLIKQNDIIEYLVGTPEKKGQTFKARDDPPSTVPIPAINGDEAASVDEADAGEPEAKRAKSAATEEAIVPKVTTPPVLFPSDVNWNKPLEVAAASYQFIGEWISSASGYYSRASAEISEYRDTVRALQKTIEELTAEKETAFDTITDMRLKHQDEILEQQKSAEQNALLRHEQYVEKHQRNIDWNMSEKTKAVAALTKKHQEELAGLQEENEDLRRTAEKALRRIMSMEKEKEKAVRVMQNRIDAIEAENASVTSAMTQKRSCTGSGSNRRCSSYTPNKPKSNSN